MAGSIQALLVAGLVSMAGVVLRMISLFGPAPVAWVLSVAAGVAAFVGTALLLGVGLGLALLGLF